MHVNMHEDHGCVPLTAVAIDRDKNSQQAVKWAVDHLLANNPVIVLIHVRTLAATPHINEPSECSSSSGRGDYLDSEVADLFRSYRLYCARKGMRVMEVILDETDVAKALAEYINRNHIMNMVVGASNRNAITRKFRNPDVPTALLKIVPDFCTVYVIWKGKTLSVRTGKNQSSHAAATPRHMTISASPRHPSLGSMDLEDSTRAGRGAWRASVPPPSPLDRRAYDRHTDYIMTPSRERPLSNAKLVPANMVLEHLDSSRTGRSSTSRDSFSEDLDFQENPDFQSDFGDTDDFISFTNDTAKDSHLSNNRDLEAEMRRLKLELKQTMDMYSQACKEAITAKKKAKELHQWKLEEARRFEEARQAEEAALAIAEMEKSKCMAAMKAATTAQKLAELEAKKRLNAELAVKRESEEKKRALDALAHIDVRYRKYSIDEIEAATDNFAESLKIGEGGYGPVYHAILDHTPVAIKVLRPDAAQGRKQFQQEVEVLSCIRHPNMVLLLGACPEYGCLVYEYMDNGSLDDRLFRRGGTPPIPWSSRFKIAAEIATGLLFLHQTKPEPLVHRDLKPGNILLDRNYVSKISDVGLARLVPPSVADTVTQYRMTSTAGTFCYIDPEYQQTGMLGIKSDIYSLGILLLQMVTAKPPMGLTHHVEKAIEMGTFQEMLDPTIKNWPLEETLFFAKLALKCAELRRKDRPDLKLIILPELNRLRKLGLEWEASNSGSCNGRESASAVTTHSSIPPRPWSNINKELVRTNPHLGLQWPNGDAHNIGRSSGAS